MVRQEWLDAWQYETSDSNWLLLKIAKGFHEVFRMTFEIFISIHEEIKDDLYREHHHTTEFWVKKDHGIRKVGKC